MTKGISDWRARIGVLNPNPNVNLTCEWTRLLPDGVIYNEAVMGLAAVTPDSLLEMRNSALFEAKKLADAIPDIILFACTSGSFVGGSGYDEGIIKELEEAINIPVTTTVTCVLTAFADLGIKKMALIGPYTEEVFNLEIKFFQEHGIDTLYSKCLGLYEIKDYVQLHEQPFMYYRMAKEAYESAPDVDAIFITCLQSPALEVITPLEAETGKLVISSCLASLYGILKHLKIREPLEELGQLGRILGTVVE